MRLADTNDRIDLSMLDAQMQNDYFAAPYGLESSWVVPMIFVMFTIVLLLSGVVSFVACVAAWQTVTAGWCFLRRLRALLSAYMRVARPYALAIFR